MDPAGNDEPTRTMRSEAAQSQSFAASARITAWGPFELREKAGEGGFGEVYRAWDPKLQREIAVKLLLPNRLANTGSYDAILREARFTAKVRHPNIVSVHGVDMHDGRVGFWTDFVHGKTLSSLLATQGPFAAREAALIGVELCRALGAVHAAGLLHRDIKPRNVMREQGGRILLMDFGLTQQGEGGGFGGTLPYMAPELLDGQSASIASDIYALGALLFELVTNKYPVEAADSKGADAYLSGVRRTLIEERPDLPVQFARAIDTALDPEPKKRFAGAGPFLLALSDAVGINSVTMAAPAPKSRRIGWLAAAVLAVIALALSQLPGVRTSFQKGFDQASGAHASYLKGQDLLDRYYQPHNLDNSIPLFQKNIETEPRFAPAWAGLGRAYWRKYLDARDPKYISLAKEACDKALALGQNLSGVHVTLGMIYADAGRNDLATQELEQAQGLDASNPEVYAALADLYRKQGRAGDVEPALQKAADLDPKDWRWLNQLGIYYLSYSSPARLAEAVTQFNKAITLTPDNARIYNNLAAAFKEQARYSEARTAYEKAIELEPDATRYSNLGVVLQMEGDYQGAAAMFRHSLELNPSNYFAAGNLASALSLTPNGKDQAHKAYLFAIDLGQKVRETRPKDALVLARLGSFYASIGDSAKSLPLLRQAVALEPKNVQVLYKAGEAHELLGRREEALQLIGQAVRAGFSLEYIRRERELDALRADSRFSSVIGKK